MNAQKARGAELDTGNMIQKRIKALVPVLMPAVHLGLPPGGRAGDGHGVPLLPRR